MKLDGSFTVARPAAQVWEALNDADVLRQAIPGCETLTPNEQGYDATVSLKIGPVRARFAGQVTIAESRAPEHLALTGEGSGGIAGFARGAATVALAPADTPAPGAGATTVSYQAEVLIGGKLAQLGSRLIASTARKLAEQFFASLNEQLSTTPETLT